MLSFIVNVKSEILFMSRLNNLEFQYRLHAAEIVTIDYKIRERVDELINKNLLNQKFKLQGILNQKMPLVQNKRINFSIYKTFPKVSLIYQMFVSVGIEYYYEVNASNRILTLKATTPIF